MRKAVLALSMIAMVLGCCECGHPSTVVLIASHAMLSKDWVEFRPPRPINWSQPDGDVVFRIDSPYQISNQFEIIGPTGERFVPEVQLLSTDGQVYAIRSYSLMRDGMLFYVWNQPHHIERIQAIRIRSSVQIQISDLRWRGYDFSKVKM